MACYRPNGAVGVLVRGGSPGEKSSAEILRALFSLFLIGLGAAAAFFLYRVPLAGQFFSWSKETPYAPLVAVVIGFLSAALVGFWLLNFRSQLRGRGVGGGKWTTVLLVISLVYVGFGAGLLGPAATGRDGSWVSKEAEGLRLISSVVYDSELQFVDLPTDVFEFWGGERPGPYIASSGADQNWIVVNSPHASEEDSPGVMLVALNGVEFGDFGPSYALSELNPSFMHVRDVQVTEHGVAVTNVTVRNSDCLVLQVWTIDLQHLPLQASSLTLLWESSPCIDSGALGRAQGSGGRLSVDSSGALLVTVGDFSVGETRNNSYLSRPTLLGPDTSYGKILRILPDGSAENVSSGHRNPQGLFLDDVTGTLWSSEHGPQAGGELNLIEEGRDYGWPDTTLGIPYGVGPLPNADWEIGRWASRHEGFEAPIFSWMPSIAPSQLIVYRGDEFTAWRGDILLATLGNQSLRRLRIEDGRVLFDEQIVIGERIRDLVELDDGRLLMSFDSGKLGVLSLIAVSP